MNADEVNRFTSDEDERLDQANYLLLRFVADVKAGRVPTSMVSDLRNAALVLWTTTNNKQLAPDLVAALWSEDCVVYSKLIELIPSFLYDMTRRHAIRKLRERKGD